MNRRQFVKTTAGAAALLALRQKAYGYAVSPRITKFVTPLRTFGVDIPILSPDQATYPGVDYYDVGAGVFRESLHPDLDKLNAQGTRLYGYRATNGGTFKHLGGAVVARKDTPVRVKFTSSLPASHILPFDATIPSGKSMRHDRAAIHLHGGLVPWPSDGGPFHWISNGSNGNGSEEGEARPGGGWLPDAGGNLTNDNFYPNHQSARFMWYHDHAIGLTRTNAYAGLASGYILTDAVEQGLGIPAADHLVIQDKVFWDPAIDPMYANYVPGALPGDLWYPYISAT
ncbi:MAG: hypothetical protein M1541_20650, partial [Acidobacteria bacterium]|nr:hypothetical protein [Acidobacteriota bacterium]